MYFETNSISDYEDKIELLFAEAGDRKIWLLSGDLGAGKTTLVKAIMNYLGSEDMVTSPTFSLVNEYLYEGGKAYHIDLYRLKSQEEAIHIGLEEYLDSGHYCFIEWPDNYGSLFDESSFKIRIETLDMKKRKINLH